MKADVVIVALLRSLVMFTPYVVEWWQFKNLPARCFVPNSNLTSSVLPETSCFSTLSLKSWSQKCRLKTSTNCCAVSVLASTAMAPIQPAPP